MASIRVGSYWHHRNSVAHSVSLFSLSWTTSGSIHGDYTTCWHTQWEVSECMFFKRGWQSDLRFITRLVLINFWSLHIQKPLNWRQFFHYSHMHFNKSWSWFWKLSEILCKKGLWFPVSSVWRRFAVLGKTLQKPESLPHEKLLFWSPCCVVV